METFTPLKFVDRLSNLAISRPEIRSRRHSVTPVFLIILLLVGAACADNQAEEPEVAIRPTETVRPVEAIPTQTPEQSEPTRDRAEPGLDSGHLTLAWTYETGGPIHQPPLRVGELVMAIPANGPAIVLELETGQLRWRYDPPSRLWERAYATDGELLFVGVQGGRLAALEIEDGSVRWEKELGIDVQVPPLVSGQAIFVPTTFVGPGLAQDPSGRARLFKLNAADGQELWTFESENYILQTPFQHDNVLYLAGLFDDPEPVEEGGHTRLYALSAADGSIRWTYESEDGFPKSVYATDSSVAFIGYQDFANGVDAATGELRWRVDTGNWVPALSGKESTIYFGSANTVVHALDIDTGKPVWRFNIPEGTFNYALGAPTIAGDKLVFLTQHGEIMALDIAAGVLDWQYATGIAAARAGLTVSGGWIFVGGADGALHAYRADG